MMFSGDGGLFSPVTAETGTNAEQFIFQLVSKIKKINASLTLLSYQKELCAHPK